MTKGSETGLDRLGLNILCQIKLMIYLNSISTRYRMQQKLDNNGYIFHAN